MMEWFFIATAMSSAIVFGWALCGWYHAGQYSVQNWFIDMEKKKIALKRREISANISREFLEKNMPADKNLLPEVRYTDKCLNCEMLEQKRQELIAGQKHVSETYKTYGWR